MATAAKSRPPPPRPRAQCKQQCPVSSPALAGSSSRTPMPVGQAMLPPTSAPSSRASHFSQDVRAPSPSYFGAIVDPTNDPADTGDVRHTKNNWSPPTSSIRSTAAPSPKVVPLDLRSQFEMLRQRSESSTFSLDRSSLPRFSTSSGSPEPNSPVDGKPTRVGNRYLQSPQWRSTWLISRRERARIR
jgi:hypothetical protein